MSRVEILLDPPLFAEIARSAHGSHRARYRVGDILAFVERGSERCVEVHLSILTRAPASGGRTRAGLTVLPVDVRWSLLYVRLQEELPLFRHKLYALMQEVEAQVGEQFLVEQQGDLA